MVGSVSADRGAPLVMGRRAGDSPDDTTSDSEDKECPSDGSPDWVSLIVSTSSSAIARSSLYVLWELDRELWFVTGCSKSFVRRRLDGG